MMITQTLKIERLITRAASLLGAVCLVGVASTVHAQTVIMSGLFNPRGLTIASDGSIYVAEAGRGGSGTTVRGAAGEDVSYGNTGGVSRLRNGIQERLISTLPSLAPSGGSGATGLHDIIQTSDGTFYGVTGFIGDPALRASFTQSNEQGNAFGRLVRFDFSGTGTTNYLAYLSANEVSNPDGTDVNSNPYSLTQTATGFVVADAGANVLLNVDGAGTVSTRTVFPVQPTPAGVPGPPVYQPVPTSLAQGLDALGNSTLFVGELSGYPFPVGGSNVFSVNPATGTYTTAFTGFTTIVDLAYSNGSLYVLDFTTNGLAAQDAGPGQLWQVNVATGSRNLLLGNLFLPGGIAVGADNSVYVTTGSVLPGGGSIIRVNAAAAPEPGSIVFLLLCGGGMIARRKRRL